MISDKDLFCMAMYFQGCYDIVHRAQQEYIVYSDDHIRFESTGK